MQNSNVSKECQAAFDFVKDSLTTVPVLAHPNTSKPYVLCTDGNTMCIVVYLCQGWDKEGEMKSHEPNEKKPIQYLSYECIATQMNWPTTDKEAFAIFYALQKLDQYLHESDLVIKTDDKPLKYIMDSPVQNQKMQYPCVDFSFCSITMLW